MQITFLSNSSDKAQWVGNLLHFFSWQKKSFLQKVIGTYEVHSIYSSSKLHNMQGLKLSLPTILINPSCLIDHWHCFQVTPIWSILYTSCVYIIHIYKCLKEEFRKTSMIWNRGQPNFLAANLIRPNLELITGPHLIRKMWQSTLEYNKISKHGLSG